MPDSSRTTLAAALLGASAGLRSFTPAAVLTAAGRLDPDPRLRRAVLLAAAGELVGDKLPFVPSRTEPLPYLGRIASGAVCGALVAGRDGALAGAGVAAATTLLGARARRAAAARGSALRAALSEDAVAIGAAALGAVLARA